MECDVTNRQSDLARHFSHPLLDQWKEQRAGFTRRIKKLDDVHLGVRVAECWRMFAREGYLARRCRSSSDWRGQGKIPVRGFCRKNLDRIAALNDPQLWQAFRPGFYDFLTTMVLLGATLSSLAIDNYPALIALVILDISIAIALLGSIQVFVKHP